MLLAEVSSSIRSMLNDLDDPATAIRVSGHETFPLRLLWLKKAFDVASGPDGVVSEQFLAAMFQGWDLKDPESPLPLNISDGKLAGLVQALVLAYLWRSELDV